MCGRQHSFLEHNSATVRNILMVISGIIKLGNGECGLQE